jgi:hypothetical protein
MLCYVMLCYAMLCYVMLCYVMLCYVMLCYVMLCYVMSPLNNGINNAIITSTWRMLLHVLIRYDLEFMFLKIQTTHKVEKNNYHF